MSLYQLELKAFGAGARNSDFRAWIDLAGEGSLDKEVEVHLESVGTSCWRGAFLLPRGRSAGFYYRVGVVARIGSCWSLSIRDLSRGVELTRDADYLSQPKAWILGSWGLQNESPSGGRKHGIQDPSDGPAHDAPIRQRRTARARP